MNLECEWSIQAEISKQWAVGIASVFLKKMYSLCQSINGLYFWHLCTS